MDEQVEKPRGELTTRTLAMPADTNPSGDIFGGWVLAQTDIAGGIFAGQRAEGRVATIAIDGMKFIRPVYVGDMMSIYCEFVREGRTSLAVHLEAWARRGRIGESVKVTEGLFTYVAIDQQGRAASAAGAAVRCDARAEGGCIDDMRQAIRVRQGAPEMGSHAI
jgi:acyl-CoA thioesterase YciA